MNYQKIYHLLIEKADTRGWTKKSANKQGIYVEEHHIIPKCMGGAEKDTSNIVVFLPEEHFVAHQLLLKIYPKNNKLIFGCIMMTVCNGNQKRINNKRYSWLKKQNAKAISILHSGKTISNETKAKMSAAKKGRTLSEEHKNKISKSISGTNHPLFNKRHSETAKAKMSAAKKGRTLSEEHKANIGISSTGRKHTLETKAKMSATKKGVKRRTITCPHCGKSGGCGIMNRWHFGNCKTII